MYASPESLKIVCGVKATAGLRFAYALQTAFFVCDTRGGSRPDWPRFAPALREGG
jgi:hypothetical protein